MFDFALKAAPNVLYSRYKQYGQVRFFLHLPCLSHTTSSPLHLLISASSTVRRASLVRRIQRDDRRHQAARRRRQHVRLHAPAGSPDMRRDPPTGPRRADADYRHTSDLAGAAAEEVFGWGQTVGRLS